MSAKVSRRPIRSVRFNDGLPQATTIAAAVCLALSSAPYRAVAATGNPSDEGLEEVIVTASYRAQTVEAVPYSISVINAEQLAATGANDLATLATEVPGLSMYDYGARFAGATAPIIRGINATGSPARGFRTFEQDPVGTYIGNSPIDGYFQLDDIERVEVLRGPQGTLYGAGALGGALRIIPNAPQLGVWAGSIAASSGFVNEANKLAYSTSGVLNVPLGDTVAFRAAAKYDYEPGWIDAQGLIKRTGSPLTGIPVLADPSDPINSPGVFYGKNDW